MQFSRTQFCHGTMYLIILLVAIEYETFKTLCSGVQWWCFAPLPSIMNCLLSKLEELLTNKYSGLISDQQNNKWRRWLCHWARAFWTQEFWRLLDYTWNFLMWWRLLITVMSLPQQTVMSVPDTFTQNSIFWQIFFNILRLYLVMLTGSHALGVQTQMQEGANCCNKLNILTFIMNSNNLLWYHFPWG